MSNDQATAGHRPGAFRAPTLSRRAFLTRTGMAAMGTLLLPSAGALANTFSRERTLCLHNVHTDEEFTVTCSPQEHYDRQTLLRFNEFLRDHHSEEVRNMDPALLDLLYAVTALTESNGSFKILSGYRSLETNSMLRKMGHGVAEHSMHIEGKAIDIRMDDVNIRTIRDVGLALQQGGVGYYPRSGFVHLDTGRIRAW
jgi:uncharacterized protein YcbK (DUF882 family)